MTTSARYTDTFVSREQKFSLGIDAQTGGYFLSTPVSGTKTHAVDYEAYFHVEPEDYQAFRADPASASAFVEACRMGRNRHLLIYPH